MQKVAKELLAAYQSKKISYPTIDIAAAASWSITEIDTLMKLIRLREILLLNELGKNMKTKLSKGSTIFDVWMKEESDLIQATAKAFGHRICMESILSAIAKEDSRGIKYFFYEIYLIGISCLKLLICLRILWCLTNLRGI